MKKEKKKKIEYIDDGRTIADMNVEGFKWYVPEKVKKHNSELSGLDLTRGERWAIIKAALTTILPIVLVFIALMAGVFWLLYLWLTQIE